MQICESEQGRDALKFRRLLRENPNKLQVLRFMETILRIVQSPFFLHGTDRVHLEQYLSLHLNQGVQVQDIAQNIYVDDINIGEAKSKPGYTPRSNSFKKAGFKLNK